MEEQQIIEYMNEFEYIKMYYNEIFNIVSYLNREINVDKIRDDSIRNRSDAHHAVRIWNEKIEKQGQIRQTLLKSNHYLPSLDNYRIRYD